MERIINQKEYQDGLARMEYLLKIVGNDSDPSSQEFLELNKLSDLIAEYEESHYSFNPRNLREMIELRMYQRKLKQKDVAEMLGTTPSRISEIINGKRKLTFELAKALYSKLNIDPEIILNS
ncbi:MAG: helix-turn-helix domain-containing protein [Bacteroidia bacterium]|nr:helix-turn-helix domain-containing protein [Bacteroidia bacterium]